MAAVKKGKIDGSPERDPRPDREHDQRLRPREAARASCQARGRRGRGQGRRSHRDRDEGEEGPRRRRPPRHPRGGRRRHRGRRRCCALLRAQKDAREGRVQRRAADRREASCVARSRSPSARSPRTPAKKARSSCKSVREGKKDFGYDAATGEYHQAARRWASSIPVKVVRTALQNAASVASLMLTTEAMVAEAPKDEKPTAGGGGHSHDF